MIAALTAEAADAAAFVSDTPALVSLRAAAAVEAAVALFTAVWIVEFTFASLVAALVAEVADAAAEAALFAVELALAAADAALSLVEVAAADAELALFVALALEFAAVVVAEAWAARAAVSLAAAAIR